ncbi:MAG: hypothetical protein ABI579_09255, partial [Candidatus Sumerlaeota bacterium]
LSSDIFSPPVAVDGDRRVKGIMLILLGMTVMCGCYFALCARKRFSLNLYFAAAVFALWPLVCAGRYATVRDAVASGSDAWSVAAGDAIRDEDPKALRKIADKQQSPNLVARVYQLESAITRKEWDDATTITQTIAHAHPEIVADAWQRYSPAHRTERDEWIKSMDSMADLSRETLERLYGEASFLRDPKRIKELRGRLHGPSWFREMLRFREEYDSGQGAKQLRARCISTLDANPFHTQALQELLHLDRESPDFDADVTKHHRAVREAIELSEYAHDQMPGGEVAFEHLWRSAFQENFQYLEWRGVARDAEGQIAHAKELGMRAREWTFWKKRLTTASFYERRLMRQDPSPPPDAKDALPVDFPAAAIARATPQWLRYDDGWGGYETNTENGESWRWTMYPTVFVPLDHSLPAGEYTLRMRGRRLDLGDKSPNVKFDFYGVPDQQRAALYAESFDLSVPLTITQRLAMPVLRMNHSTYPVSEYFPASRDSRRVGMMMYQLWVEPKVAGNRE